MAQRNPKQNRRRRGPERQRYISPRLKVGVALAAVLVVVIGLAALSLVKGWIRLPSFGNSEKNDPDSTAATQPPEDRVIHFVAGGDLNVTDKVVSSGLSEGGYDYSNVFMDVLPVLAGADVTALNFEGNLVGAPYGTDSCSAPQELMEALRGCGVDILQTANSKSTTNGLLGLGTTIDGIRAAGMENLGTYGDSKEYQKYQGFLIREVNGVRIAFVAFTKGMEGRGLPEGSESCVNLLYTDYSSSYQTVDTEGITTVLKAAEAMNPDITIAMVHWGGEFNDMISSTQTKIIKLMAQQGVDAIIGTHSHFVQQMGFDKDTGIFVAYSLGDFLGDADRSGREYSVLLDLEITKNGATGETKITGYDYTPVYCHEDEDGRLRLLRIEQAIAAYENSAMGRVDDETYENMKYALSRINSRVEG